MTVLGITGPTGAGKTTLLKAVGNLAGGVIDCDEVYHEMLEYDSLLPEQLERTFGPLRDSSGKIDRKKLGRIVFGHPDKLEQLNAIAQQSVVSCACELIEEYRKQGKVITAVDAISLLESPLREMCDITVAVLAPPETRLKRIMGREGISEEYAWARVRAQKPDEYFSQNCDYTLINDCSTAEEFARRAQEFLEPIYTQSL
ncbi:MAG: dephospho-CoA kinase [Lawsonibacter sp.]|nr:dephospho-CoA kinase [Lawsonibacter sp.]